tara:strand:+ start:28673 stop:29533 length:861 start_codon:yes stop_codon:yes gene_type:complete
MRKEINAFKKYKESGVAPSLNLIAIFSISFVVMFILTFIYSLLITFIPIIYFNIVLVVGFGYVVAYCSRYLNIFFKIRNRIISIALTGIIAVSAIYLQWVFYLYIISGDNINPIDDISIIIDLIINPSLFLDILIELNHFGAWEIGSSTINGSALWFIWLGEALIILLTSLKIYSQFDIKPFSEKDNEWYKAKKVFFDFEYIHLRQTFLESFYVNPAEALASLEKGNGTRQSNVYIFSSKNKSFFLISIENSIVNSKGRKEFSEVLEPCYLDRNHLTTIKEKFAVK